MSGRGFRSTTAAALAAALVLAGCGGGGTPEAGTSSASSSDAPMTAPSQPSSSASSSATAADDGEILPAPVTGGPLLQRAPKTADPPPGIDGLLAWDTTGYPGDGTPRPGALENTHVDAAVEYAVVPPVGGPHAPIWLNVGVYTKPVPSERAVHALEHGAVWITYRPSLPAADVAALTAFVERQPLVPERGGVPGQANRYVLMSPWPDGGLPAPVVISAWGYQLRVDRPDDPRLQAFVDNFRNSARYSPEYGSPVDGVPVLTGGRPATAGSALPNPNGAVG